MADIKCELCDSTFSTKAHKKRHVSSVHEKIKPFKCLMCPSAFSEKRKMKQHYETVHENLRPFSCEFCSDTFPRRHNMVKHILAVHEKIKPYKCPLCPATFSLKKDVERHHNSVHQKMRFQCQFCWSSFSRKDRLQSHFKKVHESRPMEDFTIDDQYTCAYCVYMCKTREMLKLHIYEAHLDMQKSQDEAVADEATVEAELTKERPFLCKLCSSAFYTQKYLKIHIETVHNKIKPFRCKDCPMTFSTKQNMQKHIECVHEKVRPFKCPLCPSMFFLKKDVKRHYNSVHDILKRFPCHMCSSSFSRKDRLQGHMKSVHEKRMQTFLENQHMCALCDYNCKTRKLLKRHILKNHAELLGVDPGILFPEESCDTEDPEEVSCFVDPLSIDFFEGNDEKPHKCLKCTFATDDERLFAKHATSCENSSDVSERMAEDGSAGLTVESPVDAE